MRDAISRARFWDLGLGAFVLRAVVTLSIAAFVQLCPGFATAGHAQISLWDQIQGPKLWQRQLRPSCPSAGSLLDDLRPDATPWRSDVMLNAVSAAIDRYQQIVASGGWPVVPPGKMMRAGR